MWGRQTAHAEKVIWKHNIRGKIERVLRANGVHALVTFREVQSPKGPVIVDVNATTNYDVTPEHRSKEGPALNPVIGRSGFASAR